MIKNQKSKPVSVIRIKIAKVPLTDTNHSATALRKLKVWRNEADNLYHRSGDCHEHHGPLDTSAIGTLYIPSVPVTRMKSWLRLTRSVKMSIISIIPKLPASAMVASVAVHALHLLPLVSLRYPCIMNEALLTCGSRVSDPMQSV